LGHRFTGECLETLAKKGADDPKVFGAYLRTVTWNTATAADRDLFQAPFRAGIRLDAYQLLPLRKSLRLPRINMLIADDVGLGKTIEAGLILRELLLRRRIDFVLVAAPPSMTLQWQDELRGQVRSHLRHPGPRAFGRTASDTRVCRQPLDDRFPVHTLPSPNDR